MVIVTNETVVASLLAGALSPRAALDLGVIVFDGEKSATEAARNAFIESMSKPAAQLHGAPLSFSPFAGRR